MQANIERKIYWLQAYCALITLIMVSFFVVGFVSPQNKKFKEIDVERINVVEKDGKLRMVISNKELQHPGVVNGKVLDRKRPVAGLLFFNEVGDECGGLIFAENGGTGQFESLTFDKAGQDQTIGIQHMEHDGGSYHAGLKVWDRPNNTFDEAEKQYQEVLKITDEKARKAAMNKLRENGIFGNQRVFVGRMEDKTANVILSDQKGNPRIRIRVDEKGNPSMDFMDETGNVIDSLPRKN